MKNNFKYINPLFMIFISFLFGFGCLMVSIEVFESIAYNKLIDNTTMSYGLFLITIGLTIASIYYMENSSKKLKEKSTIEKYKNEINLLKEKIEIQKNFNSIYVDYKEEFDKTLKLYSFQKSLINLKMRLEDEVSNLRRRAIINLILGGVITLIGLSILGVSVLSISDTNNLSKEINSIFLYYTPRILLVLFMQMFAYFFLRLYKFTLDEIKHFQNELTNIESKLVAIEIAYETDNHEVMKDIISDLLQTERNFILKNCESTIELRREKMESDNIKDILKEISSVLKTRD